MECFVTCGSGLEPFAMTELHEKFTTIRTEPEQCHPGKIFFKTTPSSEALVDSALIVQLIKSLKTAERIFGVILSTGKEAKYQSCHELLNYLFKMASGPDMKEKLEDWRLVRRQLTCSNGEEDDHLPSAPPIKRFRPATTFRVNVKVTGAARRFCDPQRIAKSVGSAIVKSPGSSTWEIDLRRGRPEIELSVYVTDDGVILAIPLTLKPISERSYLVHIPLRSTVASAMGSLLLRHLEPPGHADTGTPLLIIDPMCGTATILVELAVSHKFKFLELIGIDVSGDQLARARENILKANVGDRVSLIVGDAGERWPLTRQVDGIVCDLPFGQQHGTSESEVKKNLPGFLKGMDGAVRGGGFLVLLFSSALSPHLEKLGQGLDSSLVKWTSLAKFPLKLGELHANIFVFQK